MNPIGIGIIGGGYMGKAHAVAMAAVKGVFDTALEPRLEMICASKPETAQAYAEAFGFARWTADWRTLVTDPAVQAIVIASPQSLHRAIAEAAFEAGKPVLCEKPLGASVEDSAAMAAAARRAGQVNMVGFNYLRTPASQYAHQLIKSGRLGQIHWFRGEHTEDFLSDPEALASWRCQDDSNGCMGDLAPHMIHAALTLVGPIESLCARVETVHKVRQGVSVTNDDQASMMVQFANQVSGHLFFSRVATGRKMGYAYEVHGSKGAIRFDQEDQNALWLYLAEGPEAERGFRKILTGPEHPDYLPFCQGPGHGTGYQDMIIIEARDFLEAIAAGRSPVCDFSVGYEVNKVIYKALESSQQGRWLTL